MPFLLGLLPLFRFLLGLVPMILGYIGSMLAKLATRTGLVAFALVTLITVTITTLINYLSDLLQVGLPPDFSNLMASVLPDNFRLCITVIMTTRVTIFLFDLKEKFLNYANRIV